MSSSVAAMQTFKSLVAPFEEKWAQCESLPEESLLRLCLLREITRQLHTAKSQLIGTGKKESADQIRALEQRIHKLREAARLAGPLAGLLDQTEHPPGKRPKLLPTALLNHIPRDRFERYDRQWEMLIAAEAVHLGWSFWALSAAVEIEHLEAFDGGLRERMWPNGLVLFSETDAAESPPASGGIQGTRWSGRWIILLHPRIRNSADLRIEWSTLPGIEESKMKWRLLFSSKGK